MLLLDFQNMVKIDSYNLEIYSQLSNFNQQQMAKEWKLI
jgi:hypothetical protein